jgi:hypothetical protein
MLNPKFLDRPETLVERFALAFSRAGWREDYAKHKPAANQGGLFDVFDEKAHPRDEGGKFTAAQHQAAVAAHAAITSTPQGKFHTPSTIEYAAKTHWFNSQAAQDAFPGAGRVKGHEHLGQAVRQLHEEKLKSGGGVQQAASAPGQKGLFSDDAPKPAAVPSKPAQTPASEPPKKTTQAALFGGLKNQKGQEDLFNRDYRDDAPESARAEQPAAAPKDPRAHLANIPAGVQEHVGRQLAALRGVADALAKATALDERLGGDGRYYQDTLDNGAEKQMAAAHSQLDTFRDLAAKNGIDADKAIKAMGGIPDGLPTRLGPGEVRPSWYDQPACGPST